MATTRIKLVGPLFDGEAAKAAAAYADDLAREVAEIGQTWIRLDTERMTKSGRGGTGAAAEGVLLAGSGGQWVISGGIRQGQYAWPWLEGTSQRNRTTGFKGYGSFRRTRLRLRRQATAYVHDLWTKYLAQFGGIAGGA